MLCYWFVARTLWMNSWWITVVIIFIIIVTSVKWVIFEAGIKNFGIQP